MEPLFKLERLAMLASLLRLTVSCILAINLLTPSDAQTQAGQSQQNAEGNAIQIGTAHDVNITIAPKDKAIAIPAKEQARIPPLVAAEEMWRALLKVGRLESEPTDEQVLKILPGFIHPETKEEKEQTGDKFRDIWPQLRTLRFLPAVKEWRKVNSMDLDEEGSKRITFQGVLEPSPVAYNQNGQPLPAPFVQLLVDMNKNSAFRGFNLRGYSPYASQ